MQSTYRREHICIVMQFFKKYHYESSKKYGIYTVQFWIKFSFIHLTFICFFVFAYHWIAIVVQKISRRHCLLSSFVHPSWFERSAEFILILFLEKNLPELKNKNSYRHCAPWIQSELLLAVVIQNDEGSCYCWRYLHWKEALVILWIFQSLRNEFEKLLLINWNFFGNFIWIFAENLNIWQT